VSKDLEKHEPHFSFAPPQRWLLPEVFVVPPLAVPSVASIQLGKELEKVDGRFKVRPPGICD
jgi:hypothetical protein